jgi:hypothetical protein
MRRAQSEGIGLAVIVILIVIGFVVFFIFSNDDSVDPRRESSMMMLNQFGHVFLQSEVTYGDTDRNCKRAIYALIEDVYSREITSLGCDETDNPEDFLKNTLDGGLDNTLGAWGYDAYFEIKQGTDQKYKWPDSDPCTQRRLGLVQYPLSGGVVVEISVC